MSKGFWKKLVGTGLAVVMALSLAACGGGSGNGGGGSNGGNSSLGGGNKGKGNENSELAKQYVFSYEKIDLSDMGDDMSINKIAYVDGRIYTLLNLYIYNNDAGAGAGARTEAATEDVDTGEITEDEYVSPTNINRVVSFLPDGSDIQYFDLDMGDMDSTNSWMNQMEFGADGRIYAVRECWLEDYSDPENPISENRQELVCWENDGALLWTADLKESLTSEDSYLYVSNLLTGEDGSVSLIVSGGEPRIDSYDSNGNPVGQKPLSVSNAQNINRIFRKDDGSLIFITYNDEWTKMYVSTYDMSTDKEGEQTELPGNLQMYSIYQGKNTDFLLTNNQGVYTYNIGDENPVQIMSYVNSDLDSTYLNNVLMIDQEHFVASYNDTIDYKTQLAAFTRVDPKDVPDKKVLVLGANYLDYEVRNYLVKFNKSNSQYRIVLKDYSSYNTMEDYMAGYTKLNNDIVSGQMPDILVVDNQIPAENYIAKGLLADIGSLLAKDEELSQIKYLENVFEAYSVDGTLYYVVPSFNVGTVIGKKSILGDRTGWNMEEFNQLMSQMPEGTSGFGEITRDSFFWNIMQYCGTDFVDPSTGKCKFDSQEFISMLEYAKTLPEEINYDEDYNWEKYESQYREDRTILMPTYIYNVRDLNYTMYGQFGEEVAFVGFPNESKNGSVISANKSLVLSSRSKNLDGAWEFVRYFLTDEYQDSIQGGLPVKEDAFLKLTNEATKRPYYFDGDGNKVEYDDTIWLNGENVTLEPMSQEQVDKIVAFIKSVNRTNYYNESIQNIINEEAAPFFAGQKTAQDVAKIIQNRAQVYVNENR